MIFNICVEGSPQFCMRKLMDVHGCMYGVKFHRHKAGIIFLGVGGS